MLRTLKDVKKRGHPLLQLPKAALGDLFSHKFAILCGLVLYKEANAAAVARYEVAVTTTQY